jgi:hypothetical protein
MMYHREIEKLQIKFRFNGVREYIIYSGISLVVFNSIVVGEIKLILTEPQFPWIRVRALSCEPRESGILHSTQIVH